MISILMPHLLQKCNLSLPSIKDIEEHIKSAELVERTPFPDVGSKSTPKTTSIATQIATPSVRQKATQDSDESLSPYASAVEQKLINNGIVMKVCEEEIQFYCLFCNIHFEYKRTVISHLSDSRHQKVSFK